MRKSSLRLILPLLPLCMALNASEKTEHEFAQSQWTFQGMANTAVTGETFYGEFSSLPASLVSKPLNPPLKADEITGFSFHLILTPGSAVSLRLCYKLKGMKNFVESRSFLFPLKQQKEARFYEFKLPPQPEFSGALEAIKLVFEGKELAPGAAFSIDNVRFLLGKSDNAKIKTDRNATFDLAGIPLSPEKKNYNPVLFNSAGAILLDGKPRFLLACAIPSLPNSLSEMKKAGFNTAGLFYLPEKRTLAELKRLDLYFDINLPQLGGETAEAYRKRIHGTAKQYPEIFERVGFYHNYDEACMRKIPAKHTAILYNTVREIKPRRTVLVTHAPRNTVEELKPYSREGDAIAVDIYPVPVGYMSDLRNKTMSCVGEYADKTLKSAVGKQPLLMWLQGYSRGGYPNFPQTRFMAYNAIMHGAMGIYYYGINHLEWPNPMWNVLSKIGNELRSMEPVLTAPWLSPLLQDNGVELRARKSGDDSRNVVWFLANTLDVPRRVTLRLPHEIDGLFQDFTGRKIMKKNDTVIRNLKPFEIQLLSERALILSPSPTPEIPGSLTVLYQGGDTKFIWMKEHRRHINTWVWFRRSFELADTTGPAELFLSGDDCYQLFCNGSKVAEFSQFPDGNRYLIRRYDLKPFLKKGKNTIAIAARHDLGNAGLWLEGYFGVGKIVSGREFRVSDNFFPGFEQNDFDDSRWRNADELEISGSPEAAQKHFYRYLFIHHDDLSRLEQCRKSSEIKGR